MQKQLAALALAAFATSSIAGDAPRPPARPDSFPYIFHGAIILTAGTGWTGGRGEAQVKEPIGPFASPAVVFVDAWARLDHEGPPATMRLRLRVLSGSAPVIDDNSHPAELTKTGGRIKIGVSDEFFLPKGETSIVTAVADEIATAAPGNDPVEIDFSQHAVAAPGP